MLLVPVAWGILMALARVKSGKGADLDVPLVSASDEHAHEEDSWSQGHAHEEDS